MAGLEALLADRQLFIFDLDGTLADSSPIHAAAFAAALSPHGLAIDYALVEGLATTDAMRLVLERANRRADDVTVTALVTAKRAAARDGLAAVREIKGAGGFVARAATSHRLALCTSAVRMTVDATLAALDLVGQFEIIVTADDVPNAKPAPDPYLAVLELAQIAAADALVFEDSEVGLKAAHAAGLETIRIGNGGSDWAYLSASLAGMAA